MLSFASLLLIGALTIPVQADRPTGVIRIDGRAVADDRGPFPALGASLFWAAWAYKHDRPRLDAHLELLSRHNFDYIRALGTVGRQPYWQGREIDWRWPDYDQVIAGLTDHAFDRYGIRVQWTIFADAEQMIPDPADRVRLVDRFVAMSKGREHKIMHFELANESWQNGFGGPGGLEQLRSLARHLDERTSIPVAISDSDGHACADHQAMYRGAGVQIMTEHFPRDLGGRHGRWGPVVAPWAIRDCEGVPKVVSNNEPIGPRSSVETDSDPYRIVAAAVVSWMSGVGLYVFHTDAGVWGRESLESMPGAPSILKGLAAARRYVPPDIVNWTAQRGHPEGHALFKGAGAREVFTATSGDRFFVAAIDVPRTFTITAQRPIIVEVIDPLTGKVAPEMQKAAGESLEIGEGPVVIVRGRQQP